MAIVPPIKPITDRAVRAQHRKTGFSDRRLESISKAAVENVDGIAILQAALRDHDAPVCGHKDGLATFWSCMANLNARDILYSLGAPCRNEYRRYFKF